MMYEVKGNPVMVLQDYILDGATLSTHIDLNNKDEDLRYIVRLLKFILEQGEGGLRKVYLEKGGGRVNIRVEGLTTILIRRFEDIVKRYKKGDAEGCSLSLQQISNELGAVGRQANPVTFNVIRLGSKGERYMLFSFSLLYSHSSSGGLGRLYLNVRSSPTKSAIGVNHLGATSSKEKKVKNKVSMSLALIPFYILRQLCGIKPTLNNIRLKSVQLAFTSKEFETIERRNLALEQIVTGYSTKVATDRDSAASVANILGLKVVDEYGISGATVGFALIKDKQHKPYVMLGVYGKDLKEAYLAEIAVVNKMQRDTDWLVSYEECRQRQGKEKASRLWDRRFQKEVKKSSPSISTEDMEAVSHQLRFDVTLHSRFLADQMNFKEEGDKFVSLKDLYSWLKVTDVRELATDLILDMFKVGVLFPPHNEDGISGSALRKRLRGRIEAYYPGLWDYYKRWIGNSPRVSGKWKMPATRLAEMAGLTTKEWEKLRLAILEDYGWDISVPIRAPMFFSKLRREMLMNLEDFEDDAHTPDKDNIDEIEEEKLKKREILREAYAISNDFLESLDLVQVKSREIGDYYTAR